MTYFFDTSALIKLYHPERGSKQVETVFNEPGRRILISRLAGIEFHSALGLKTRVGQLDSKSALALRISFLSDIASGSVTLIALAEHHCVTAENLIVRYGGQRALRTLDALHWQLHLKRVTGWAWTRSLPPINHFARLRRIRVSRFSIQKLRKNRFPVLPPLNEQTVRSYSS